MSADAASVLDRWPRHVTAEGAPDEPVLFWRDRLSRNRRRAIALEMISLIAVGYIREYHVHLGPGRSNRAVCDFAHPDAKVDIELDGPYHIDREDSLRDEKLRSLGWKVIRIRTGGDL